MKKLLVFLFAIGFLIGSAGLASANTIASSTMWFEGILTETSPGIYTGTIAATPGTYYMPGGPGTSSDGTTYTTPDGSIAEGGFDVYAEEGGTAYVQGMTPDNWTIGSDHDAYSGSGPWGSWYDPDVADWDQYSLELTTDHWYLRYTPTGESPMSGDMDWSTLYAAETDLGTQAGSHDGSAAHGGGAGAWDWDCGWGVEVIPLEYAGFQVGITDLDGNFNNLEGNLNNSDGDTHTYIVSLAPVPEPSTMLLLGAGLVGLFGLGRKKFFKKS